MEGQRHKNIRNPEGQVEPKRKLVDRCQIEIFAMRLATLITSLSKFSFITFH